MIILKYGDLKKKQKKTRWNAKCDDCGCKVIVEKEDTEKFRQEIDYEGCPYTEFTWVCPFCHETQTYNEYDSTIDNVNETLSDWKEDAVDNLMDQPITLPYLSSYVWMLQSKINNYDCCIDDVERAKAGMEILYLCRELGRYDSIEKEQRDEH